MESSRKCTKCGEVKPLEEFSGQKKGKFGKKSQCKCCVRVYNKENKEKIAATTKSYREANKEKLVAYSKKYYESNKEKLSSYNKSYREANKEKLVAYSKKHYESNKDEIYSKHKLYREHKKKEIAAKCKAYREDNKEKIAAYLKNYKKERLKTDNHFKMVTTIRRQVSRWKNGSTIEMIGISFREFADMYGTGEGMHLDHKIPMSWFDIDNADHNKVCQHHTNLQWLTPKENLFKSDRYADVNGTKVLRKDFDLEAYVRDMLKKLA